MNINNSLKTGIQRKHYNIEDLGDDSKLDLYAEFSEEHDRELAHESVQTWICDNRLEVTSCVCIALDNCKLSFCNWYRASEQHSSPDELILYCLGRQNNKHVSIFNAKYVWSTLANHIKYDYFEVLKRSNMALIFLGPKRYAILRKKPPAPSEDNTGNCGKNISVHGKGRGHKSSTRQTLPKKTTCRKTGKKCAPVSSSCKYSTSLQE